MKKGRAYSRGENMVGLWPCAHSEVISIGRNLEFFRYSGGVEVVPLYYQSSISVKMSAWYTPSQAESNAETVEERGGGRGSDIRKGKVAK